MTELDQIKSQIDIFQLAAEFGCNPDKNGKCKHNALREERTSSLVLYRETNSYHDFGSGIGGSVIDFYRIATGKSLSDTIIDLKQKAGIVSDIVIPQKKYMSDNAVKKAFESPLLIEVDFNKHKSLLIDIAPEWLLKGAEDKDKIDFYSIIKYAKEERPTILVSPLDSEGVAHTLRYRHKIVGDTLKKWVALYGTRSSYEYCRLTNDKLTLIVEGTRDYLTAILCGFSVIAIPSSNHKIDNSLLKDRFCVFIDDDDGKNFMMENYENAVCEKALFDHKEFKKITKCDSKDFSDYLYQFKDYATFKDTFIRFVEQLEINKGDNWLDIINKISMPVTKDDIINAENMEFLYPEILIKKNITTIVAPPNTGKTAFTIGLCQDLLDNKKVENIFYFDPDAPISYMKETLININKKHSDKFKYYNGVKNTLSDMIEVLRTMTIVPIDSGNKSLIVCDGLQFFTKGTIGEDVSSKEFLELLKQARDHFGATIILLHHTKKNKDDNGNYDYIGSQIIEALTDNMIIMQSKNDNLTALIKKSRSDKKNNIYNIDIDFKNRIVTSIELRDNIKEDEESQEDTLLDDVMMIHRYLKDNPNKTQKQIQDAFKGSISRNRLFAALKDREFLSCKKGDRNSFIYNAVTNEPIYVQEFDFEMPDF